jgi:N-acetylmuramoyl-L-alanine amidase
MHIYLIFFIFLFNLGLIPVAISQETTSPVSEKIICLDAGHGGTAKTDSFRAGPAGEREEWINLRVALLLQKMLEEKGAKVVMTRTSDDNISLSRRAQIAKENNSDIFLSIHHNATADPKVNFPIIYFHGNASENKASVILGKEIGKALREKLYQGSTPVSIVSDHVIFSRSGTGVLRGAYGIPGVIAEASFFTNPEEEVRLKQTEYNRREALAYLAALENYFKETIPPIHEKNSILEVPPFRAFQEAERMNKTSLLWYKDYIKGKELIKGNSKESLEKAYELFTRSARSFPDSYVAAECHRYRADLLRKLGRAEEAQKEEQRVQEFYVPLE